MKRWFDEYAMAHRHPSNRLTHKIAIPMIVFHVVAMLNWLPIYGVVTVGVVAAIAGCLFYAAHHAVLGAVMAMVLALILIVAPLVPWQVVVAIAVVGWVIQLIGHSRYEKNRPAFLDNMMQALVGPVYFLAVPLKIYKPSYQR
jgi:uncharacterized membrane protein YGL010W